jgi:hypothetical protein
MKSKLYNISIRGRVAYSALCLENAINKLKCKNSGWNSVLDIIWSFTSIQYVDDWLYMISHVMPSSILEDDYEENEMLGFDKYQEIKSLYHITPSVIFEILEFIYECGTVDLYGKIIDNSPKTLRIINDLEKIMKENEIPLPNTKVLEKYHFEENEGWGKTFNRQDL